MGFSKKTNAHDIAIEVHHPWHPGTAFIFHFPKTLPQGALEAEKTFLGLKDNERPDEYRKALINVISEMATREPEGFEDFPGALLIEQINENKEQQAQTGLKESDRRELEAEQKRLAAELEDVRKRQLSTRMREYFDDPHQVEFEAILVGAWRAYRASCVPSAYLKSLPANSKGDGSASRGAAQA